MLREKFYNITKDWKLIIIYVLIVIASLYVNQELDREINKGMDIYYSWVEGRRILLGENPYSRIHESDMRQNDKYATYFPLFYQLSFLSQRAGLLVFEEWMSFWRKIFLFFNIATATLMFFYLAYRDQRVIAVFSSLFWLFNRWTLYQVRVAYFDFIPVFFMVLSMWFFTRNRYISLFLLSFSLAFKQIAIFLVPLYLIWIWQGTSKNKVRTFLLSGLALASVPFLTSLPFLILDLEGFIRSIFFSVTRIGADHFGAPTLSVFMDWEDFPARLPMLLMFALVYLAAWQKKVKIYTSALLVMLAFVEFNPVQFRQYLLWVVVFIPFLFVDSFPQSEPGVVSLSGAVSDREGW
jgi:hypothetical protein